MKKSKTILALALLPLALGVVACGSEQGGASSSLTTNLTLSDASLSLLFGDTYELSANVSDPSKLIWTSTDERVARVEEGTVTATGAGKAQIVVSDGVSSASCSVEVGFGAYLPSLEIENIENNIVLAKGSSFALKGQVSFRGKRYSCPIVMELPSDGILQLDGNSILGKKAGTTHITVKGRWQEFDNAEMKKTIEVKVGEDISMRSEIVAGGQNTVSNRLELSLISSWQGKSYNTSAKVRFVAVENGTEKKATISADDSGVVEVSSDGTVTAKKVGTALVSGTFISETGTTYTANIRVEVISPLATATEQLKISSEAPFPLKQYFGEGANILQAKQGDRELKFSSNGFLYDLEAKGADSEPILLITNKGGLYFPDTFVYTRALTKDNFLSTLRLQAGRVIDGYYILDQDILDPIDMTSQIQPYYADGDEKNRYFSGTFDGQGHTIAAKVGRAGIFGGIGETPTIKNTHFEFTFANKDFCSGLAWNTWTNWKGWKATLSNLYITTTNYYDHSYALFEARFNSLVMNDIYVKLTLDPSCGEVKAATEEKGALFRTDNTITNGPSTSFEGDFRNVQVVTEKFMPISSGYISTNLFTSYARNDKDKLGDYETAGVSTQVMCCVLGSKPDNEKAALFGKLPGATWYFAASKNTDLVWVYEAQPTINNGGIYRYDTVKELQDSGVSSVGSWVVE